MKTYVLSIALCFLFFKPSPAHLYYETDSLRDGLGRRVEIFVRFVPEQEMPYGIAAITIMGMDKHDKDACFSEYGIRTISVRISAVNKALFLLAHEFGHVGYQVPNLRAYHTYYTKFYLANTYKHKSMGHNDKDPSGKMALNFTKRFRQQYFNFLKLGKKLASHMRLLQQIKDQIKAG